MNQKLLGFHVSGSPIRETKPGMIYTACTINCRECRVGIRGMGGPSRDSKCLTCYKQELDQLCGQETPVSVQCAFTYDDGDSIEVVGGAQYASMVSVYLRLPSGEVVPVTDHQDNRGLEHAFKRAKEQAHALAELLGISVEPNGALDSDFQP